MPAPVIGLCDVNAFYASCEKLFRPDLCNRPVVVLSNNDGCIVARSAEAKALGVKMGQPYFEVRGLLERYGVEVFSSNYAFYQDISNRVMRTLEGLVPRVAIYSIDEAFLDAIGMEAIESLDDFGRRIRHRIQNWVGVPVCVGWGPSKTLAKLANHAAKADRASGGVVDLTDAHRRDGVLAATPVSEVWGVGPRISKRLADMGITTARDLATATPSWIRGRFSVVLEKTARELAGTPCFDWDDAPEAKQQVVVSRTFGQRMETAAALHEALAQFTTKAAEKLRREGQLTGVVHVFLRTNVFNADEPQHTPQATVPLAEPSDDTRVLLCAVRAMVERMVRPGFRYSKAGVMLSEFTAKTARQGELFQNNAARERSGRLMAAMDAINASHHGRVFFAAQRREDPNFRMRRERLSPAYTTRWAELPCAT